MPSNRVQITDAAWVQIMSASSASFAIVQNTEMTPNGDRGVTPSRIKWRGDAAQPALGETDFSTAGPGDQINGLATEPVWAIAFHPQGSAADVHDG